MTITVDTAVLDTAGSDTVAAMTAFTRAVSTALGALGGPGMTGTDPAGLVVGQAYDDAAQGAVEGVVDIANGCACIGDLLRTSAYNYAIANHYSAIKPGGVHPPNQLPPNRIRRTCRPKARAVCPAPRSAGD